MLLGVTRDDGKRRPAIFKAYDFTKGETDIVDQKMSSLSCKAKSARWKMVAFYYILDSACVNSTTLLALRNKQDPRKLISFDTGFELATALVRPHILRRPKNGIENQSIHRLKTKNYNREMGKIIQKTEFTPPLQSGR